MIDGRPFELDKDYVVATKQFLAAGKDGYTAFIDPSVRRLPPNWGDDDQNLQTIFIQFAKSFRQSQNEIDNFPPKQKALFNERLKLFAASTDKRDEKYDCITFVSVIDNRMLNVR